VNSPDSARGFAYARAALAGNPSDGYGGAVLAVTLPAWRAEAEARAAPASCAEPANELVEATLRRFERELGAGAARVRWRTSIPQRVGLGSSSALVIAVLRALCELHSVELGPNTTAELALAVEVEELGIVAGLQDRVVQAHEGLVFMDFAAGGGYEQLDRALLPALVIAWRQDAAAISGAVHGGLRDRYQRGEPLVHESITALAASARAARDALVARDPSGFARCVDQTLELRARMLELDPRCVEMVRTARSAGAAANYTGSGGAIVAVAPDAARREAVARALERDGCRVAQSP
jgi:glucuronokinase